VTPTFGRTPGRRWRPSETERSSHDRHRLIRYPNSPTRSRSPHAADARSAAGSPSTAGPHRLRPRRPPLRSGSGRRASAKGATNRKRELGRRCGDNHTPARSDTAAPAVFTGRMREVVMLAGSGFSNREIAEWLQLSVRTVEGHMYRRRGASVPATATSWRGCSATCWQRPPDEKSSRALLTSSCRGEGTLGRWPTN
jgi:DNA-binding CsgD family transcriptional regulator